MTFSPVTGIKWEAGGAYGQAQFGGGDANLLVLFYNKAVENTPKSIEAGRRICENQIYITIQHPGETLNKVDRPATEADKVRFRDQWSRFVQNRTQIPEGTPIDLLFPNHPAVGENLRAYGVYTIEQCAQLTATAIDTIGRGAQEYVNRAQAYIKSADRGRGFHELQRQLEEERQKNRLLEQQVGQLRAKMDALLSKIEDPLANSNSPPFIIGHDAQAARINANHPTKEIAAKAKVGRRPSKPVEPLPADPITDEFATGGTIKPNKGLDETDDQDAVI